MRFRHGEVRTASQGHPAEAVVRLGGGVRSIERQVTEVIGSAGSLGAVGYSVLSDQAGRVAWDTLHTAESKATISARINARPLDALDIADRINSDRSDSAAEPSTICDMGFGALTVLADAVPTSEALAFVQGIISAGALTPSSYVIERCPLNVKSQIDVFSDIGSSIALMRRVKRQYDPGNTLNPGRFAGKI